MPGELQRLESIVSEDGVNGVEKMLKLSDTISLTNMYMFNEKKQLQKYNSVQKIVDEYIPIRLLYYQKRRAYLLHQLEKAAFLAKEKMRYLRMCISGEVDLRRLPKQQAIDVLERYGFVPLSDMGNKGDESGTHKQSEFNYLLKLPMDSVTEEKCHQFETEMMQKEAAFVEMQRKTEEQLWLDDLEELEKALDVHENTYFNPEQFLQFPLETVNKIEMKSKQSAKKNGATSVALNTVVKKQKHGVL